MDMSVSPDAFGARLRLRLRMSYARAIKAHLHSGALTGDRVKFRLRKRQHCLPVGGALLKNPRLKRFGDRIVKMVTKLGPAEFNIRHITRFCNSRHRHHSSSSLGLQ
jgi:hypothetical protein